VPAIAGVGAAAADTLLKLDAVQPLAAVAVTVNVPAAPMVLAAVSIELLQLYDVPPPAVRVVVPAGQKVVVPVIVAVGAVSAVTATEVVAVQPTLFVTVTV
jgi:hypothetical protein